MRISNEITMKTTTMPTTTAATAAEPTSNNSVTHVTNLHKTVHFAVPIETS